MQTSLTVNAMVALFCAMVVLAVIPSISVVVVSTRSASFGLLHGVFTTIGIVVGDIVFILMAILGLSLLAKTLGGLFFLIKYLGGAYLILLGIRLLCAQTHNLPTHLAAQSSLLSSFLTGLLITLGDQKATLFYLGFLPAFLDITRISVLDTLLVIAIAIISVGGVKLGYAFMAHRVRLLINSKMRTWLQRLVGGLMIAVGIFLIVKP